MIEKLLPARVDNTFRGHVMGLWIFGAVILLKFAIGMGTVFNGRTAATRADGIPLTSFGAAGEQAFLSLFAAWGVGQVALNLLGLVVLLRYRALVAFYFVVLLAEHVARRLVFWTMPLPRDGTSPGLLINLVLAGVMIVGLLLTLDRRPSRVDEP